MWNNNNSSYPGSNNNAPYPPPGGYGQPPAFPAPGGFGPPGGGPPNSGYNPGYNPSYGGPPQGPPGPGGFGNPSSYPPPNSSPYPPPNSSPYPPPNSSPYPPQNSSPYPPPNSSPYPQPNSNPYPTPQGGPPPFPGGPGGPGSPYPPGGNSYNSPPPQPPRSSYPGQQTQQSNYGPPPTAPNTYPGSKPGGPPPPSGNKPMGGPPQRPPAQSQNYGPVYQGQNHQNQQRNFQYSQCNRKKKALCIGINYFRQQGELKGCINDANNVQQFLIRTFGYKSEDIVMLTDDAKNPRQIPTRANILEAMQWLVRGAEPNDSLFFHYSGHGGQTKDLDGDEDDGYDEVIYPVDFKANGHIVDDVMHEIMIKPLPQGCRLTAIFDSCHSGSALDLPFIYSTEGKIKEPNMAADLGSGFMGIVSSYNKKDMGGVLKGGLGLLKTAQGSGQKADQWAKKNRSSPADAISWSGCKDSQTSADTVEAGRATGAMSHAFMTVLGANSQMSYQQLLNGMRDILKSKYSQKPQLSSSHPIDTSLLFIC